jgi:predicted RNA-binding Zn-ribbon protein involved in translation (DUF1610 family)
MPFILSTDFNGIDLLSKDGSVALCKKCNQPTGKWTERVDTTRKVKKDFSCSRDGFTMVTKKFKDLYDTNDFQGCDLTPLSSGDYILIPTRRVDVDLKRMKYLGGETCPTCGQITKFRFDVTTTAISMDEDEIGDYEIVRSRLETPRVVGCDFLVFAGKKVVDILRANNIGRIVANRIK